jgi:hypothetical protein
VYICCRRNDALSSTSSRPSLESSPADGQFFYQAHALLDVTHVYSGVSTLTHFVALVFGAWFLGMDTDEVHSVLCLVGQRMAPCGALYNGNHFNIHVTLLAHYGNVI